MNVHESQSSEKANKNQALPPAATGQDTVTRPAVPILQDTPNPLIQKEELTGNEDLLQGKFPPIQKKGKAALQLKSRNNSSITAFKPVQRKENKTGLPDNLKSGVENLSGTNLSDVKVHYGSSQPAQFNALAYAQGTDIHIAPGQEQHLPHEAWHVAQQKQGRVQPTTQMKGAGINDDISLEKEADDMGAKAISTPVDSLASGYEHFNKTDIGEAKAQSSLVSTTQRQTFENINSEISDSLKTINHSNNSSVQKQTITQLVAGKFLVADGEPLQEGQMSKSSFLAALRGEVQKVAKEVLEPVGLAQNDCPDLNYWISFYSAKDVSYFEAAIAKYAPATAEATNSTEYLAHLTDRVKQGLVNHVETGQNHFDPEEVPASVEEKRADPAILNIQRKAMAPIQFDCCSSAPPAPQEKAFAKNPQTVMRDLNAMSRLAEPARCQAYVTMFQDAKVPLDDGAALLDCSTPANREHNYRLFASCGDTQLMIMTSLFGAEGVGMINKHSRARLDEIGTADEEDESKRKTVPKINVDTAAAFITAMKAPGKVACCSAKELGAADNHCFTLATSSALDAKENTYYLYQGWVDTDNNVLDPNFTKEFSQAQFEAFIGAIVVQGTQAGHFPKNIDSTTINYLFF